LGFGLRTARVARGLGMRELARMVDVRPQELSHWEIGTRVPKIAQVGLLLGALRVEPVERQRLLELAEYAREPNWLERSIPGISPRLSAFIEYERTASAIFAWEPLLIPGLLQTPDYIRSIMDKLSLPIEQADNRLRVRLDRQRILTRQDPVRFRALIGEQSLRENFGGAEVMSDQIDHLLEMSGRANISLRIVPSGIGYHPGLIGPFDIYEFADSPPIASVEHVSSTAFLHEESQTTGHKHDAKGLRGLALSEEASQALLREAAR